jgi:hypothetical protein
MRDIKTLIHSFIDNSVSGGNNFGFDNFDNRKDADYPRISTRNQLGFPVIMLRKAAYKTPRGARMYAVGGETGDVLWPRV